MSYWHRLHQGVGLLVCSGLETPARDVEGLYMTGWPLVAGFLDPGIRFLKGLPLLTCASLQVTNQHISCNAVWCQIGYSGASPP